MTTFLPSIEEEEILEEYGFVASDTSLINLSGEFGIRGDMSSLRIVTTTGVDISCQDVDQFLNELLTLQRESVG